MGFGRFFFFYCLQLFCDFSSLCRLAIEKLLNGQIKSIFQKLKDPLRKIKIHALLLPCLALVLVSCAKNNFESHTKKSQSSEDDFFWNDEENGGEADTSVKNVCKTSQFTIYSNNEECPNIQKRDNKYDLLLGDYGSSEGSELISRRPVDIFFVINASPSMWYYLNYTTNSNNQRLQGQFSFFIPILNQYNKDWRIFLTNSDYSKGFFQRQKWKSHET